MRLNFDRGIGIAEKLAIVKFIQKSQLKKSGKMNIFKKAIGFIKESRQELSKVVWLSRNQVIKYTAYVVIAMVVSTLIVAAFDIGLIKLVQVFILR